MHCPLRLEGVGAPKNWGAASSPGMIMSARALLDSNPNPSDKEIRDTLAGNLCRCTGYVQIVKAVKRAAREMNGEK